MCVYLVDSWAVNAGHQSPATRKDMRHKQGREDELEQLYGCSANLRSASPVSAGDHGANAKRNIALQTYAPALLTAIY